MISTDFSFKLFCHKCKSCRMRYSKNRGRSTGVHIGWSLLRRKQSRLRRLRRVRQSVVKVAGGGVRDATAPEGAASPSRLTAETPIDAASAAAALYTVAGSDPDSSTPWMAGSIDLFDCVEKNWFELKGGRMWWLDEDERQKYGGMERRREKARWNGRKNEKGNRVGMHALIDCVECAAEVAQKRTNRRRAGSVRLSPLRPDSSAAPAAAFCSCSVRRPHAGRTPSTPSVL